LTHPTHLLITRTRIVGASALTAFCFAIKVVRWGHTESWLFTAGHVWHGWLPIALDVFLYGYLCWLGFCFIRGTKGPERFFMVGWFADILLSPLELLRPQWALEIKQIGAAGLAVALLAALSLLLKADPPSPRVESQS
jgi:hypothetical protein